MDYEYIDAIPNLMKVVTSNQLLIVNIARMYQTMEAITLDTHTYKLTQKTFLDKHNGNRKSKLQWEKVGNV